MYDGTVTLFNYHGKSGNWYTRLFDRVQLAEVSGEKATPNSDRTNSDTVEIFINVSPNKSAVGYVGPKAYSALDDPADSFTFKPESDFVIVGNHVSDTPINDDDYDEGLYHALNNTQDGVYIISSVAYYSLLPHFEIGGR